MFVLLTVTKLKDIEVFKALLTLKCFCFWETTKKCIKSSSCFPLWICSSFSSLDTPRMFTFLHQCQCCCSGMAEVSRVVRFVWYLCLVVFIRARMGPICCLGCQPSPSSQQVFCAVLCVTVSALLDLGDVADCFEFPTVRSSTQLKADTHTHIIPK